MENIGPDDEHEFKERATVDASNGPWQYRTMPILPRRYIRGAKREMQVPTNAPRPRQQSLPWSVTLHLAPGAIFTLALVLGTAAGIEPALALFAGIGVVLVPLELGYLSFQSHRTTGSWSPLGVVDYRDRLPTRKLSLLASRRRNDSGFAGWAREERRNTGIVEIAVALLPGRREAAAHPDVFSIGRRPRTRSL